jgi:hypothetical protein
LLGLRLASELVLAGQDPQPLVECVEPLIHARRGRGLIPGGRQFVWQTISLSDELFQRAELALEFSDAIAKLLKSRRSRGSSGRGGQRRASGLSHHHLRPRYGQRQQHQRDRSTTGHGISPQKSRPTRRMPLPEQSSCPTV